MIVIGTEGNIMSRSVVSQFHSSFDSCPSTQHTGNEGKEEVVAMSMFSVSCAILSFNSKQELVFEM